MLNDSDWYIGRFFYCAEKALSSAESGNKKYATLYIGYSKQYLSRAEREFKYEKYNPGNSVSELIEELKKEVEEILEKH